jgi:hypothetical protein
MKAQHHEDGLWRWHNTMQMVCAKAQHHFGEATCHSTQNESEMSGF